MPTVEELEEQARTLSLEERMVLVHRLSADLVDFPFLEEWVQEAEDRIDAFERGEIGVLTAEEADRRARKIR